MKNWFSKSFYNKLIVTCSATLIKVFYGELTFRLLILLSLALDIFKEGMIHSSEFWVCSLLTIIKSFVWVLWETGSIMPPLQYLQMFAVPPVQGFRCLSFLNVKLQFTYCFIMFRLDCVRSFYFFWESCLPSNFFSFGWELGVSYYYFWSMLVWYFVANWLNPVFNNSICLRRSGISNLWLWRSLEFGLSINKIASFSISFICLFMFWVS